MNTLRFDELKEANLARVGEFKNRLGRIAHAKSDGSDWTLAEWTNAMAGEAGEACNYSKKIRRGDFDDNLGAGIQLLLDEIADVVIYADLVASQTGHSLSAAIIRKFNSKSDEVGSKIKLSAAPYLRPVCILQTLTLPDWFDHYLKTLAPKEKAELGCFILQEPDDNAVTTAIVTSLDPGKYSTGESVPVVLEPEQEPAPGSLLCFWDGNGFRKINTDGTAADPKQWRSYVRIEGNTVICTDAKNLPRCFMVVDPPTIVRE